LHYEVARAIVYNDEVPIILPSHVYYSFYNSPYIAHKLGTAIDVYFDDYALFPTFEGTVLEVKWFNAPKYRVDGLGREPLIVTRLNDEIILKVLHVMPKVKLGDTLTLGDPIGKVIISGYLLPWSTPHAHFEVRNLKDPYRARGAYKLRPILNPQLYVHATFSNVFRIVSVEKYFAWLKIVRHNNFSLSPLLVELNGVTGCLDAGIPHYLHGGVIVKSMVGNAGHFLKSKVLGLNLNFTHLHSNVYTFTLGGTVKLRSKDGSEFRGLGVYLGNEMVKLIFLHGQQPDLKCGDEVELTLYYST